MLIFSLKKEVKGRINFFSPVGSFFYGSTLIAGFEWNTFYARVTVAISCIFDLTMRFELTVNWYWAPGCYFKTRPVRLEKPESGLRVRLMFFSSSSLLSCSAFKRLPSSSVPKVISFYCLE